MVIHLMNAKNSIGIIGYGNMGSAIARQLKDEYAVAVFDSDVSKTPKDRGLTAAERLEALVAASQVWLGSIHRYKYAIQKIITVRIRVSSG